ncbi:MAG: bifunctional nicotinamide-nucleotide adenylyltransferase/Nudix hydroxylase, partial [Candidatus Paceibacterota bacterium]
SKMKYDYTVFIGRFQPFHNGHAHVLTEALKHSRKVIVLVGSSGVARSWRNPFTYSERASMIYNWALHYNGNDSYDKIITIPLGDHTYNNQAWITQVQQLVTGAVHADDRHWTDKPASISLIGHSKDSSSFYMSMFPQWNTIDVSAFTDRHLVNATEIRNQYFSFTSEVEPMLKEHSIPQSTVEFMMAFHGSPDWNKLRDEHNYLLKYREDHKYAKNVSYNPTHTTVDACVVQSGHILLIRRGANPGKGLLALPGGFVNEYEKLKDAMLRELREETKLKVPTPVLRGNIRKREVFDEPHRSGRGRIFSHTFLIVLPPDPKGLPRVKGSSDAVGAVWMPLSELKECDFFEDHYHIIMRMTGDL